MRWLGVEPRTGERETLVGTSEGVVRAFAVRGVEDDERWDREDVEELKGTPRRPLPNRESEDVTVAIGHQADADVLPVLYWRSFGKPQSRRVHIDKIHVSRVWVHAQLLLLSSSSSWYPSKKSLRRVSHKDRAKTRRIWERRTCTAEGFDEAADRQCGNRETIRQEYLHCCTARITVGRRWSGNENRNSSTRKTTEPGRAKHRQAHEFSNTRLLQNRHVAQSRTVRQWGKTRCNLGNRSYIQQRFQRSTEILLRSAKQGRKMFSTHTRKRRTTRGPRKHETSRLIETADTGGRQGGELISHWIVIAIMHGAEREPSTWWTNTGGSHRARHWEKSAASELKTEHLTGRSTHACVSRCAPCSTVFHMYTSCNAPALAQGLMIQVTMWVVCQTHCACSPVIPPSHVLSQLPGPAWTSFHFPWRTGWPGLRFWSRDPGCKTQAWEMSGVPTEPRCGQPRGGLWVWGGAPLTMHSSAVTWRSMARSSLSKSTLSLPPSTATTVRGRDECPFGSEHSPFHRACGVGGHHKTTIASPCTGMVVTWNHQSFHRVLCGLCRLRRDRCLGVAWGVQAHSARCLFRQWIHVPALLGRISHSSFMKVDSDLKVDSRPALQCPLAGVLKAPDNLGKLHRLEFRPKCRQFLVKFGLEFR